MNITDDYIDKISSRSRANSNRISRDDIHNLKDNLKDNQAGNFAKVGRNQGHKLDMKG